MSPVYTLVDMQYHGTVSPFLHIHPSLAHVRDSLLSVQGVIPTEAYPALAQGAQLALHFRIHGCIRRTSIPTRLSRSREQRGQLRLVYGRGDVYERELGAFSRSEMREDDQRGEEGKYGGRDSQVRYRGCEDDVGGRKAAGDVRCAKIAREICWSVVTDSEHCEQGVRSNMDGETHISRRTGGSGCTPA